MSLSKLPRELILAVGDILPIASLSQFLRTCRSLHQLLWPALTTRINTENLASSVLLRGIGSHHLPTVNLALAHNAAWHTRDKFGQCSSALANACGLEHLEIVSLLITHYGPTILTDNQTPSGDFCHDDPLLNAVRWNNLELTTLLLRSGAPTNLTVWYGYPSSNKSPLDYAAKYGSAPVAEVLIKYGADVSGACSSFSYAVRHERWDVARVLLREGVMLRGYGFEWSNEAPLGTRTPSEIEAWLTAGAVYMTQWRDANRAKKAAASQRRLTEATAAGAI